jgi:WD40 repeat protein
MLLLATGAHAQSAPPVLRIETGGHNDNVREIGTDRAGRVLVTASDDKTARIWSLPDLRPLGVLRPPVGPGNEGQIYAVAVSPSGKLAAVGGWIGGSDEKAVLIFDIATKQIVARLGRLPNVVDSLAFSDDGRRLAAGLGGANGIRIWDTEEWRQIASDPAYRDDTYGLSFAPDGRLATASYDGSLRLYSPEGTLVTREQLPAGLRPFRIAFSPDNEALAVGFDNSTAVEVRGGSSLKLRARAEAAGSGTDNLARVAWTDGGNTLLATTAVWVDGKCAVFAWNDGGYGRRRVLDPGFATNIFGLHAMADGRVAIVSSRGELAVIDAGGNRLVERGVSGQDLRTGVDPNVVTRRLAVSGDGSQVAWVARNDQHRWLRFDVARLGLSTGTTEPSDLTGWTDQAGSLRVTGWDETTAPKLNGVLLALSPYERSRSVAVRSNQVLLGSDWSLRLFDANGRQRWVDPSPGAAWRVNQSGDGRLAIVGFGDGTIRWFRADNGRELLALFVTADAQRWVAWTPTGYYAASPGGDELIGWLVNRGRDQAADFFSAARFRDRFYRPDVTNRILATLDEAAALRQADAERGTTTETSAPVTQDLPPVVAIRSPADGTTLNGPEATIAYTLRSPSGKPLRGVRVLLDGRPAPNARGLDRDQPAGADGEVTGQVVVPVPPGHTVDITLIASTDTRTSEPARLRVTGAPVQAAVATQPELLPRLNAVVVGVSAYPDQRLALQFAAKDATDFGALLRAQAGKGLYREVNVHVLTDQQATRAGVMRELDWLRRSTTTNDVAIMFLAGHGVLDEGSTFFLPVDGDPDSLFATAVGQADLQGILSRVPGRVVAFVDICHAGSAVLAQGQRGLQLPDMTAFVNQLHEPGSGLIVFASATSRQPSLELPEVGNGAFTAALLAGLRGAAAHGGRPVVRTDELNVFVADKVRDLTHGRQSPIMQRATDVPDFPLLVVTQ